MTNFNVRRESGSQIYQMGKNAQLKSGELNTKDHIVNIDKGVRLKDLEGALERSDNPQSAAFKDAIVLQSQNEQGVDTYFKVDLQDPQNRQLVENMIADLKSGQNVSLDPNAFNVIRQNRDTTLEFGFDNQRLERMTHSSSETQSDIATQIRNDLRDFEYTHMKDGQSLTDQQKLTLAVQTMNQMNVDPLMQKQMIGQLFYNQGGNAPERIQNIQTDNKGNVTVDFVHIADFGDTQDIQSQTFQNVQPYNGTDDHGHQGRVDHITQRLYNSHILPDGTQMSIPIEAQGTHLGSDGNVLGDFLRSRAGAPFQNMTPAERNQSNQFKSEFAEFKVERQQKHVNWAAHEAFERLENSIQSANNGAITYAQLANQALNTIMGLGSLELNLSSHTTPTLEDEAAVAVFMNLVEQQRTGNSNAQVRTNYDNDTGTFNIGPESSIPELRVYQTKDPQINTTPEEPVDNGPPLIEREELTRVNKERESYQQLTENIVNFEQKIEAEKDKPEPNTFMIGQYERVISKSEKAMQQPQVSIDNFSVKIHNSSEFSQESKALWRSVAPELVQAEGVTEGQGHKVDGEQLGAYSNVVDAIYDYEDAVRSGDTEAIQQAQKRFEHAVEMFTQTRSIPTF